MPGVFKWAVVFIVATVVHNIFFGGIDFSSWAVGASAATISIVWENAS